MCLACFILCPMKMAFSVAAASENKWEKGKKINPFKIGFHQCYSVWRFVKWQTVATQEGDDDDEMYTIWCAGYVITTLVPCAQEEPSLKFCWRWREGPALPFASPRAVVKGPNVYLFFPPNNNWFYLAKKTKKNNRPAGRNIQPPSLITVSIVMVKGWSGNMTK